MPTIIHNDTCPICAREVATYARAARAAGVALEVEGLDAAAAHGLSRDAAARRMHVVEDGVVHDGLDAFLVVWRRLPGWRWLARLVELRPVRPAARWVYDRIAAPALYALHRARVRRRRDARR